VERRHRAAGAVQLHGPVAREAGSARVRRDHDGGQTALWHARVSLDGAWCEA
jgi:hypothetical protein